jgi:hypothetical protein
MEKPPCVSPHDAIVRARRDGAHFGPIIAENGEMMTAGRAAR